MLNRGNPCSFGSVREMSWMPNRHSWIRRTILDIRSSLASLSSREQRGTKPASWIVKTIARKRGRYSSSNGQLMKTLSA